MNKPKQHLCLYIIRLIWHAQGSGASVDGYLGFKDQASADAYVKIQTAGRDPRGPVPQKYMTYETVGLVPVRSDWISNEAFKAGGRGHIRVDNLEALQ